MRALIVSNYFSPEQRGGAQKLAEVNARALADLGHEVVILTMGDLKNFSDLWPKSQTESDLVIYRWFPLNLYFLGRAEKKPLLARFIWTMTDLINPAAALAVLSVLRRVKPDIVISHNLKGLGGFTARLLASGCSRYVHVLHDVQLVEPSGIIIPGQKETPGYRMGRKIYTMISRWLYKTVPRVASPTRFLIDFYSEYGFFKKSKKELVINPSLAIDFKKKPHETFNVLFIGQLEVHKGINILLAAWSDLPPSNRQLIIVGSGSQQDMVRAAAGRDKTIIHLPWQKRDELDSIWSTADLLVVPSICIENSPLVMAEAISRQVTIIASAIGGIPELRGRSSLIQLVEANNCAALNKALNDAMSRKAGLEDITSANIPTAIDYTQGLLDLVKIDPVRNNTSPLYGAGDSLK